MNTTRRQTQEQIDAETMTTIAHVGGHLLAMVGANACRTRDGGVMWNVSSKVGNRLLVKIGDNDTYTIEVGKYSPRTLSFTVVKRTDDVHVEQLRATIGDMLKMAVSL
jgi:hypothetical protein